MRSNPQCVETHEWMNFAQLEETLQLAMLFFGVGRKLIT